MAHIITGKTAYEIFMGVKIHFMNNGYDISLYGFNPPKIKWERFVKSNPVRYAQILAEKTETESKLFDLLIPSFVEKDWFIVDFVDDYEKRDKVRSEWKSRLQGVLYNFRSGCYHIKNENIKFDKEFKEKLLSLFLSKEITLETFLIMKSLLNLDYKGSFLWESTSIGDRITAYNKLVKIDHSKYKKAFREIFETPFKPSTDE